MAKNIGAETREVVLVLIFMLLCSYCCTGNEYDLLLSIKNSMNDPLHQSLSNWNISLSYCEWEGIACDNSSHVAKIELSGKNLSGKIPESFFHLPYIETIDLSDNQLSGGIQINISSCLSLRHLNLSNNNFTGPLPEGSIPKLQALDLSNNMLSGRIPEGIGFSYPGLEFLDLGGNVLVGKIPKSISNMTGLQILTLASNQLTGEIPQELGLLKSLTWIYLGYNNFSGGIPSGIGELTSMIHLDLVSNNLSGEIPSSFGNLTSLQYLYLYFNKLTGPVPRSIFGLTNLVSLDLSDNLFSGQIPEQIIQLQNLEVLHLFSNNFTGKIPDSISSLPRLQVLQLWSNDFSGEMPKNLGHNNNLTVLDLSTNTLVGKIPDTLCDSGRLFKLILFSNSLTGGIPNKLSSCKSLMRIRLQNNRLSGRLPPEFTKLPLVYFLDLSNNNFSGTVSRRWEMPKLQMLNLGRNRFSGGLPESFGSAGIENLDLSANGFTGGIPASFGDLSELMELRLSENRLSGEIPEEISLCEKLVSLNLSHNQLTGRIPPSLTQMPVLGQLDLSVNQFSGQIPKSLGAVESLIQVNISHNHFHGSLPSTGAFLAINSSAVAGNNRLCGGDLTAGLPPCTDGKPRLWLIIVTCLLVTLAALVVSSLILVFIVRKRDYNFEIRGINNEVDGVWALEFFDSKASKEISINNVVASMRDENVITGGIGGGGGVMYKGKSEDVEFVVKELSGIDSVPTGFWTELGKLKHPNIEKVIGVIRSKKCVFLVCELVQGKSVSEVFLVMSWDRRRKVALGIAKALHYLHCRSMGSSLGCELSPEKIVVDGKGEPRLRLRSSGRICTDAKTFVSSAYIAPETREAKATTEKSDIYLFGLILIEFLTGKTPDETELGLQESVVEWARYCYSDCHLDAWVDPMIKGSAALNNHHNEIVETMNLALQCTADDPAARPCASDVVKTLESVIIPTYCVFGLNSCSSTI